LARQVNHAAAAAIHQFDNDQAVLTIDDNVAGARFLDAASLHASPS
jgi:hypothetical protein